MSTDNAGTTTKTALINGGGTGIGRAAAIALAAESYAITVAGRTTVTLEPDRQADRRRRSHSDVRPWSDLVVDRSRKTKEALAVKALQTREFSASAVTPSLPAIQHRQHESPICRSFRAL